MATVSVDKDYIIASGDPYLTYKINGTDTAAADRDGDTYVFPIYQNYIKITNLGEDFDLHVNVGGYQNITIHPGDSFEGFTDFMEFDVKINGGADDSCDFVAITKELGNTPVFTIKELWEYLAERDKAGDGDIVITGADKTDTSAATANAAIEGDAEKYEVEHTFTLKDTDGTNTHTWFSGNMPVAISDNTSTAGKVALAADYITFVQGVGKINAVLTGTWAQGDAYKVKVTGTSIMGFAVNDKEITDTLTA
jgi:hypothetical protein